jgi:hypothetical protein
MLKPAITPKDLIVDSNTHRAAEEIIDAFNHWVAGRTTGELYEELGLKVGSPEITVWLRMFFEQSQAAEIDATDLRDHPLLDGMANAMLFSLWLGSRIERMGNVG